MFKKTDPNTFTRYSNLYMKDANGSDVRIGYLTLEYQVTLYEDVQTYGPGSVMKAKNQKFILGCTQRINIFNPAGVNVSPQDNLNSYLDYPSLINTSIHMGDEGKFILIDYTPQTVNTQIQSSLSDGVSSGTSTSNSISNTVGSSTSETNSFGVSISASTGVMAGTTSTASYEHSSTVTHDNSKTSGSDIAKSRNNESSNAASMSMKDWGAYCLVNPNNQSPMWTFGQEYPWDAIECRKYTDEVNPENENQVHLVVPSSQLNRLYNGFCLYPPSELSVFGVNFVMKASWLVMLEDGMSDQVNLYHIINYFQASHMLNNESADTPVNVYMDREAIILSGDNADAMNTTINLNFMALAPLSVNTQAAIVGFIPSKFIVKPVPATIDPTSNELIPPVRFKIISTTNDLLIADSTDYQPDCSAGAGFRASDTSLSATFSETCPELKMTLYFKVIDSVSTYNLYLKHWKTQQTGVQVKMTINKNPLYPDDATVITQYVDAMEAEGGEGNLLTIALRNQNFASVDYHDYLQLGLNSIEISITPLSSGTPCEYEVRAISIESN